MPFSKLSALLPYSFFNDGRITHQTFVLFCFVLCCACVVPVVLCVALDMPELMGASLFNNMDPAQLAQLQKMAQQVGLA